MSPAMATAPTHGKSRGGNSVLCGADDNEGIWKTVGRKSDHIVIPSIEEDFYVHEHFSVKVRPQNLREVPPQFLIAFEGCPIAPRGARHIRRHILARSVSAEAAVRSFDFVPHIDPHVLWCLLTGGGGTEGLVMSDHGLRLNTFLMEDRFGVDRFVYLGLNRRLWDLYIDSMPGRELLLENDAAFVAERPS